MPGHLETLLAFDRQYQRDQQQSPAFLHRRDRRYALDRDEGHTPDIHHWLTQLQALNDTTASSYPPELRSWQRFAGAFISLGALLGIVTMSGLLFYDGGQQINITVILGVILLQLVLALFTAIQGLAGWQPWAPLMHSLQHRLEKRQPSSALLPLFSPMMARTAQAAGLAFGVAGLMTLLTSVVLQDLAFGWSTTLETSAEGWHRIVSWVAAPWSAWLPVATPSLELVADTRFFRLENASAGTDSARWGAWWPFVAMAWLTWTVAPRLLLLILATVDLRRKSRRALHHHPGYTALLWRMETPAVETGSDTPDSGQLPADTAADTVPVPHTPLVVCWAGASPESALPTPGSVPVHAGGSQSLQADRNALEALAGRREPRDRELLVLTRAWEPPTAELEDFLEDAATQLPGITLTLLPLATAPAQRPSYLQLAQWLRFANRAGQGIRIAAKDHGEHNHDGH
ncbi:DUF2868 domain-containing protein [Marinobacter lacisalsi]|uniref:DUF2868 domain-containing protein n=1 Tax=Marinobacter lacisalsi TaxID=475979 RepID=A0ABV8QCC3_9GAMM